MSQNPHQQKTGKISIKSWLIDDEIHTFLLLFQLANIVAGYSALVKSLNEELVTELINKDELTAEQDSK